MQSDFSEDLLADVPRRLQHPYFNVPVLDWWKYDYDHVFVVLNPFFLVPGYAPDTAAYGPMHTTLNPVELMTQIEEGGLLARVNPAPDGFEDIIKQTGRPVRWQAVAKAVGMEGEFDRFARTVWLQIIAGEIPEADMDLAARIEAYCDNAGLYRPEEDVLPAMLEPALGHYLAALGETQATLWNEWRDMSRSCPVSSLSQDNPATSLPGEKLCAVTAPGVMLSWAYDDVAGLLAMTDARRSAADPADYFEGFWATPETTSVVFEPESAAPPLFRN
ncbi:hypothetical protein [Salipiger abyssi]|uniref:Uncharacterized protein n=1 Tax=Salipiger abyssi TaxID=1250539 RepID=A0A1P8UVK3_9RHOB|nr:hypothetical protein [Salipiger abyssi]APZ53422.1 hypothetical protein Ga0080574_TMP3088 [Salipiger abyssi]